MSEQETSAGEPPDPLVGQTLADRYEVTSVLAEGGMGRVYRGVQRALDRKVAIKTVHAHLMFDERIVTRFMEEARVASRLSHSNIVDIYDFGRAPPEQGGSPYIVMELLEGVDLATELDRGAPMPLARMGKILGQVLSALAEAHSQGVTHRDVKPANVFLVSTRGADRVKVIDFGIAKKAGGPRMTQVGTLVGSPNYMPPEQVRGEPAQPSTDLYAVGAILFEMLTGTRLFDDESPVVILQRQLSAPRPDPREIAPDRSIPEELAKLCMQALDVDPAKRFATADELSWALERAIAGAKPSVDARAKSSDRAEPTPASSPEPVSKPGASLPARQPGPATSRYRVVSERTGFAALHRLEREAAEAEQQGDRPKAQRLLERGIRAARDLVAAGDADIAASAWSSFGRRLGTMLQAEGRADEARGVLQEVLDLPEVSDRARAAVLEVLARVHEGTGQQKLATDARRAALVLARKARDPDLLARLERQSSPPSPNVADEPPKRSTWRSKNAVRPGGPGTSEEPQPPKSGSGKPGSAS
jgi:serine/threonine protein kinase